MPAARIEKHEDSLKIVVGERTYLPGPVNPHAFYFDQSPNGLAVGAEVEVEPKNSRVGNHCIIRLPDGSKKMWHEDSPLRDDHLLPDYPRALTGGLPIVGLVRNPSLCAYGRDLLPVADEERLLDLDEMRALAAEQMSKHPQYAGQFDGHVAVRIRKDVRTKMGQAFAKDELSIAKPELDGDDAVVWSFHKQVHTHLDPHDVEFLPEPHVAPGMR